MSGNSTDRRKDRRLAERVARLIQAKRSAKPFGSMLDAVGIIVMILLFLFTERTPALVVTLATLTFVLLSHLAWNFWWIEDARPRQTVALIILASGTVLATISLWPKHFDLKMLGIFWGKPTYYLVELGDKQASHLDLVVGLRILNLKNQNARIQSVIISAKTERGTWVELEDFGTRKLMIRLNTSSARLVEAPDLIQRLRSGPIEAGDTAQGWLFCRLPNGETFAHNAEFRARVIDASGRSSNTSLDVAKRNGQEVGPEPLDPLNFVLGEIVDIQAWTVTQSSPY